VSSAPPRIRILHVLLSLEPGGLENGVVNVVNRLDRARFESSVCCLKHAGEFARRIDDPAVRIHEMGWRGGNDPKLALRLAALFRQTRPHVVHTRNAESFFYGFAGAKLARVPALVHSEHGRTFDDNRARFTVQRLMTRFTDAVFAVSEQLKTDLVRHVGMPASAVEVLHNGVDFDRFRRVGADTGEADGRTGAARDLLRHAWGAPADAVVVGTVGRLVPVKNYALLLRAVAATGVNAHVVLAGDGPERAVLAALAESLGIASRVHFLGHCNEVDRVLPAFDLFVLPSFSEGMSNTLLEAMAAGVAPVASDVGGNREIVRDGIDGFLFPNDDQAALASRLVALCADEPARTRLGAAARERAREAFDIRTMIARYERLYERVLAPAA
jgi:sugar transferase (PEP-CTERM/EpsH1 system associated)